MKRLRRERSFGRVWIVLAAACVGCALGAVLAYGAGKGLRPGRVEIITGLGRVEALRLPGSARRLADVRSFVVRLDGADDYGRVFVNNYLVLNAERSEIFYTAQGGNPAKANRELVAKLAVQRNQDMLGKRDVRMYLRPGVNHIVAELENSIFGPCILDFGVAVNGEDLESFPRVIPDGFFVEPEVANEVLLRRFRGSETWQDAIGTLSPRERAELAVSALDDAVCARRIFQFVLE